MCKSTSTSYEDGIKFSLCNVTTPYEDNIIPPTNQMPNDYDKSQLLYLNFNILFDTIDFTVLTRSTHIDFVN